mgnify:CR=1 FL=1
MFKEFELILNYRYSQQQQRAVDEITAIYKERFGVDIAKILFQYDDTISMFDYDENAKVYPSENSRINQLFMYFKTNKQWHDYLKSAGIPGFGAADSENDCMNNTIKSVLDSNGFDTSIFFRALYLAPFECHALVYTYGEAEADFMKYSEKVFNPDTMESIYVKTMFVVYKSRELLEQAKASGEVDRIKEGYYNFMKERDPFNLISKDDNGNYRHLYTRFDSPETKLSQRLYEDLYFSMASED